MTPARITRHLVLDAEAASALLSSTPGDPKRAVAVKAVAAANGQRVVPTAVRGESGWDRTRPAAANANRLVRTDDVLDRQGADRVAQLRSLVVTASVVDAAVALAAERVGRAGGVVGILTSDLADLKALAPHVEGTLDVVLL